MADFRKLEEGMFASPQITPAEVAEAQEQGITLIINNRPDDEEPGQPAGATIEEAANSAGIAYRTVPVGGGGFGPAQVEAMRDALASTDGPILAYCRTGTRSTLLWSLSQAAAGRDLAEVEACANGAGYDLGPVRQGMELLSAQAKG